MKVRIDQNLNRSEKTVALSPELEKVEETLHAYKQVCSTIHKKLCEYIPSAGKGTDGQSVERRLKKTGDFLLGQCLSEQGRALTKQQSSSCLGQVSKHWKAEFYQLKLKYFRCYSRLGVCPPLSATILFSMRYLWSNSWSSNWRQFSSLIFRQYQSRGNTLIRWSWSWTLPRRD